MRTKARAAVATVAALTLGGTAPLSPTGAGAGEGPLEEAGRAAEQVPFSAVVSVQWSDQRGPQTTRMELSAAGGAVRVRGPSAASAGGGQRLLGEEGWLLSWRDVTAPQATPPIERKYEVTRQPGPVVAGRLTDVVLLRAAGELRERLAVDRVTGLVLRRELFGSGGRPARVITVERLETGTADRPHTGLSRRDRPQRLRMAAVPAPYRAPSELAEGYRRVGAYERWGVVHVLYSDGLHGLSLFLRRGSLSGRALASGGQRVRVGRSTGVRYGWPGGEVITWGAGPVVHTLVGDGSFDEVLAAARSLPPPRGLGLLARLNSSCRRVAEVISGGR